MKKTLVLFVCALTGITGFAQGKKVKSPLDGRIYSLTITEEGKKKAEPFKDDLSFVLGKIKANTLINEGFTQVEYSYEVDSSASPLEIKFSAEAKNEDKQTRFSWEGTCSEDKISGTAILRKKGKIEKTFQMEGVWKNKKKTKTSAQAGCGA